MGTAKKFYVLSIDPDSGYSSFGKCCRDSSIKRITTTWNCRFFLFFCLDDIVEKSMDDPKFVKTYPMITNQNLLDELIRFIELPPKRIKGVGIANGELFKKENGRQVSGSHRYSGVLEEDGTYNLYKRFKGGPLDGKDFSLPFPFIFPSIS